MPVIFDCGSAYTRAGLGSYEQARDRPSIYFRTIIGRYRREEKRKELVGDEAFSKRIPLNLSIKHPVEHGIVCNFDDMKLVWRHVYELMGTQPEIDKFSVLIAEPCGSKSSRERTTQMMFEEFEVPALYIANESVLALLATGRRTGLVVSVGDSKTSIVPVYEGHALDHRTQRGPDLAGRDLTEWMVRMLRNSEGGYSFTTTAEREIVRDIKEKLCYVALDFDQEMRAAAQSSDLEKSYELPDGRVVTIGNERFRCPEALFQKTLVNEQGPGVHECTYNVIQRCHPDMRDEMFANIVLTGGSVKFPGFRERMQKEMQALAPKSKVEVIDAVEHAVWVGGSILASQPSFVEKCISIEEYWEYGPSFVHRKCF